MGIQYNDRNNVRIFTIMDESFDRLIASDLKNGLIGAINDNILNIIIDMGNCRLIKSAGLGLLVSAYKTLQEKGGLLKLCRLDQNGKELFMLCKLDKIIETYSSEDEAVASFYDAG